VINDFKSPINVLFNTAIKAGTGAIEIRLNSPTGPLVQSLDVTNSPQLKFINNTLTITSQNDWLPGNTYFINFSLGSVTDLQGQSSPSLTQPYDFITASTSSSTSSSNNNAVDPAALNNLMPMPGNKILMPSYVKALIPEVVDPGQVIQSQLGNITVLSGNSGSGTIITKILPNGVDKISGKMTDVGMSLTLNTESSLGLTLLSPAGPGDLTGGKKFISNLIELNLPKGKLSEKDQEYKNSLNGELSLLSNKINSDSITATKVISLNGDPKSSPISIAENNQQNDLIVLNLLGSQQLPTVNTSNLANVMVVGSGIVKSTSKTPVNLVGDNNNQTLIGSPSGNNFLSGGGGTDTLIGGSGGYNTFVLGSQGNLTIQDFLTSKTTSNNTIACNIFGVNNLSDLVKNITNIKPIGTGNTGGFSVTIANSLTVNLIGVPMDFTFTPSMFTFS